MIGGERDQDSIGVQNARVVEDGFKSGRGGYNVAGGIEEGVVRGAEDFRGAAAEDDISGFTLYFCARVFVSWR